MFGVLLKQFLIPTFSKIRLQLSVSYLFFFKEKRERERDENPETNNNVMLKRFYVQKSTLK